MKNILLLFVVFLTTASIYAQDTFSIVALDPDTGEVGSAGASCVTGVGASGIIDIITDIIPGRGGVNSQAWVCIPNTNLENAILQMEAGSSPDEIIDYLLNNDSCSSQNFNPAYRQYGIVDFDDEGNPRTAGWTGDAADDYKDDVQGATYSVQGNILLNATVLENMENNFNNTPGTLADRLMAAMQGANFAGADSRCLAAGTSSTTAYLIVYAEDDAPGEPSIRLNVGQQPFGTEPIDLLQDLYDELLASTDFDLKNKLQLYPNPVGEELRLASDPSLTVESLVIHDINGRKIIQTVASRNVVDHTIPVSNLEKGVYFLSVTTSEGNIALKFVKQ